VWFVVKILNIFSLFFIFGKAPRICAPYIDMKYFLFLLAIIVCGATEASPQFKWELLWNSSWEEKTFSADSFNRAESAAEEPALSGTLHNKGEIKLHFLPHFTLRNQILGKHPLDFGLDLPWGDPVKGVTNFNGGLYHKPTGSRLLYGVLDEWGLSARIRNPWIRSPPYAENHKPLMADLKTAVSSTKEDEVYLYLSAPNMEIFPNIKMKGFISAQTEVENFTPALSGGVDLSLSKTSNLMLETFYSGKTLPRKNVKSWFSDPPPLVEREFHLYSAGILYTDQLITASSDFAFSETYTWGNDIYCNFGITLTPPIKNSASRLRPLSISFAADSAGERFTGRDGSSINAGFRSAAKIEWKGKSNSLFRINTVLRSPGTEDYFNRSSAGVYYRFPSGAASLKLPIRLSRISFSADRNSENLLKINDSFSGSAAFSVNPLKTVKKNPFAGSPLGITFSGSYTGETTSDDNPFLYPIPFGNGENPWNWKAASVNCELYWSPLNLQLKSKIGVSFFPEKDEKWDFSISAGLRFKQLKVSFKAASPDFPEKWNWTISSNLHLPR